MLYLGAVKIDENNKRIFQALEQNIPKEKKKTVKKFYYDIDRYRTISGYSLLKYLAKKYYNISEYTFRYNKYGKPYFNEYENIFFNISHSHEWVICGISNNEIGVDVEKIKDLKNKAYILGVAKQIMTDDELEHLKKCNGNTLNSEFFRYWTAKEALLKCIGSGLADSLNYKICPAENGSFTVENDIVNIKHINLSDEYFLSVCMKKNSYKTVLSILNLYEL